MNHTEPDLDFTGCFAGEPDPVDPGEDLTRGRDRRRRGHLLRGAVATVAVLALAAVGGSVLASSGTSPQPIAPTISASPLLLPSASPPATPAADTAPSLHRNSRGSYVDSDGRSLNAAGTDLTVNPFHRTTENSWTLAVDHLDPTRRHLADYERFAFTGGGAGGQGGVEIGQKLGWKIAGERGEGVVQLAVSRLAPGESPRFGGDSGEGLCWQVSDRCRTTRVDGRAAATADTDDGGFAIDLVQDDGELASIVVSPLFGNNTDVALKSMDVTREKALELLSDPALDVLG